jgi:hypothetical protein
VGIRIGWKFVCAHCPFTAECEHAGISVDGKECEVIDYQNRWVTIKPPMENTLVFLIKGGQHEDIIPTEKEVVPESLLEEARDKTLKED